MVDREGRFAIGRDRLTGQAYLAIPVANRRVDYEERYGLSEAEYDRLRADREAARVFAQACREHRLDDRLLGPPGADRGVDH